MADSGSLASLPVLVCYSTFPRVYTFFFFAGIEEKQPAVLIVFNNCSYNLGRSIL